MFKFVPCDDRGAGRLPDNRNKSRNIEPTPTIAQSASTEHAVAGDALKLALDEYGAIDLAARAPIGDWLASFMGPGTSPAYRLLEYRIDSVEPVNSLEPSNRYDQVFRISYAVLPGFAPSHWIAGDGRFGKDGWIIEKVQYVGIHITNGNLYLKLLGTCLDC